MKWNGLCPAGKHGLDIENQRCELCPIHPDYLSLEELRQALIGLEHLMDGRSIAICLCGRGQLYEWDMFKETGWRWRLARYVQNDCSGLASAAGWLCPDCCKKACLKG